MVTCPQVSEPVATPVALVPVLAGYSNVRSAGICMLGAVVSCTIMFCTALLTLPQASVAFQVRAIVRVPPQDDSSTTSLWLIVHDPLASVAVATPVALVLVSAGHSKVRFEGITSAGAVVSRTTMCCTRLVWLPHSSVAVQVRKIPNAAPQPLVTTSV